MSAPVILCPFCSNRFDCNKLDKDDTNSCPQCGAEEMQACWTTNSDDYDYKKNWRKGKMVAQSLPQIGDAYPQPRKAGLFNTNPDTFTTWKEYQLLTAKTSAMYPTTEKGLLIFALGLAGEATELYAVYKSKYKLMDKAIRDTFIKEGGDILWYAAMSYSYAGLEIEGNINMGLPPLILSAEDHVIISAGKYAETIKKIYGHNHPIDRATIRIQLDAVIQSVSYFMADYGISLLDVCRANIAKLKSRYPEGFSTERSINRKD